MLKAILLAGLTSLVLAAPTAFADDNHEHSKNICAKENAQICAHLGFLTVIQSSSEAQFYVHFFAPPNKEMKDLKVDLWMDMGDGHGHGSSPVEISPVSQNKFKVQNAYFVMTGTWLVRLRFTVDQQPLEIDVPVSVKK